jgi:hypothetical protein
MKSKIQTQNDKTPRMPLIQKKNLNQPEAFMMQHFIISGMFLFLPFLPVFQFKNEG